MAAPKTKKTIKPKEDRKSIQLIVFAPAKADPNDEDSRIYIVCPSSLKVVEVIEKFDDDAEEYITLLNKNKQKKTLSSRTFIEDLGKTVEVEDSLVDETDIDSLDAEVIDGVTKSSAGVDDLDEDVVAFASDSLGDIFPDEGGHESTASVSDVDLADALSLLDKEEDEEDLKSLDDFVDDEDEIREL